MPVAPRKERRPAWKPPLRRVDPTAPLDSLQAFLVGFSNLGSLTFRAVVAPQVVFPERLEVSAYRDHRRSRGIERDGLHLISRDASLLQDFARSRSQRLHVIVVGLGRVFRSSRLRCRGYSATAESSKPRSLSCSETRTLACKLKSTTAFPQTLKHGSPFPAFGNV